MRYFSAFVCRSDLLHSLAGEPILGFKKEVCFVHVINPWFTLVFVLLRCSSPPGDCKGNTSETIERGPDDTLVNSSSVAYTWTEALKRTVS